MDVGARRRKSLICGGGQIKLRHVSGTRTRSARIASRADQGCGGRAGRAAQRRTNQTSAPPPMLLGVYSIGPEFASVLWSEGISDTPIIADRSPLYAGLAPTPWRSWSGLRSRRERGSVRRRGVASTSGPLSGRGRPAAVGGHCGFSLIHRTSSSPDTMLYYVLTLRLAPRFWTEQ